MYNVYYFWNSFENNLRTLSDWFLTKHPVNKNTTSLNPEINVLICGCLLYYLSVLELAFVFSALDCQNVICIVELVKEILHNDWAKAVHLKPIIAHLYMIIQR